MAETRALAERDEAGLTLLQRRLLAEIVSVGSWQQAAKNLDIDPRTVRRYFKEDGFKQEYDAIFNSEEIQVTRRHMEAIASGAPDVYDDALKAEMTKKVTEECPHCGEEVTFYVNVIDFKTRMKAAETLLKTSNLLKDTKRVEGEFKGTMTNIQLTGAEMLALMRLDMGMPIPPHVYEGLKAKVPDLKPLPEGKGPRILDGNEVEGEFTEVEEEAE